MNKRQRDPWLLASVRSMPCVICDEPPPSDPSHIKSVGSGGPDTMWNVYPMCRKCHRQWHDKGRLTFFKIHPEFLNLLKLNDWQLINGTLVNPRFFRDKKGTFIKQ